MTNFVIEKLKGYQKITVGDTDALAAAFDKTQQTVADTDLISEGDTPGELLVMLDGWACRYKYLHDGGRQITAFLMPGDFCDMHVDILGAMDHSIGTLTPVTVARVSRQAIERLVHDRPGLRDAFRWAQLVDEAVLRAWIVNIGRREGFFRVAHLLCELWGRARNIGLVTDGSIALPLTQTEIADALGLTPVHVNRILKRLREDGTLVLGNRLLTVPDAARLAKLAGFDSGYLHRAPTTDGSLSSNG